MQVTAIMLKTISGVAASSRRLAEAGLLRFGKADTQDHRSNGASHSQSGGASSHVKSLVISMQSACHF